MRLAYELITHHMAFPGRSTQESFTESCTPRPVPIEDLVPGIDPEIAAIVERAMAREADARYQNLEELRQDVAVVRTRLLETTDEVAEPPRSRGRDAHRLLWANRLEWSTAAAVAPELDDWSSDATGRSPIGVERGSTHGNEESRCCWRSHARRWPVRSSQRSWSIARRSAPHRRRLRRAGDPVPAPPTATPADLRRDRRTGVDESKTPLDEQLRDARDSVRRHIVAGDRQRALDALVRGLALDAKDPALNGLAADLVAAARRTATDARTAATTRLADVKASAELSSAESRGHEAENLLRKRHRIGATRAFLGAAALYSTSRNSAWPSRAAPPAVDVPVPPAPVATHVERQSACAAAFSSLAGASPSPAAAPTVMFPAPRDPSPDPSNPDPTPRCSMRSPLRRGVSEPEQCGGGPGRCPRSPRNSCVVLEGDFSNYRRYGVEVRGERISVDG